MLQRKRGMHLPLWGDGHAPGWEDEKRRQPPDEDQYSSGNSSVVTLRSHSVMIQSFRSGSTW